MAVQTTPRRCRRPANRASISRAPDAYGATSCSEPRSGSASSSPVRPLSGREPSAVRSSTTRQLESSRGARVATWTRIARPIAAGRRNRGRDRGRDVDDEQVARVERVAELVEPGVQNPACRPHRDHQPDAVAREAARLGRLAGLERLGEFERGRAHPGTSLAGRAPGPGSGRWAGSPSISASSPGTLSSGSGRSEMSSPGNASWCIRVRMSPGSTA